MPYFVFKVLPQDKLELIETYPAFKEAMARCRSMRAGKAVDDEYEVRMIFAEDVEAGRRLLRSRRSPPPLEEWEA